MYTYSFRTAPTTSVSAEEIQRRISSETWFAPFEFDGRLVPNLIGGGPHAHNYKRFMHMFPALLSMTGGSLAGKSVLDIGCHVGFWSIQARAAGAERVVGVEAARRSVDVANFVLEITGLDRLSYAQQNAYDVTPDDPGEFDVVLYLGLLYHLDKPVSALERLAAVTKKVAMVDTQVVPSQWPVLVVGPEFEQGEDEPFHSNVLRMIPSRGAVVQMLRYVGFREVYYVPKRSRDLPRAYVQDRRETFIAVK